MDIEQICNWLQATHSRPAPPRKVAEELNRCPQLQAGLRQWGQLYRSLEARFHTQQRQQFTPSQRQALRDVADFGSAGGMFTNAFPGIHRAQVALQLMARVIAPSLVNQGPVQLCGPAAVVVSLAHHDPLRYVTACIELADRGRADIAGWLMQPAPAILNHVPGQGLQADWILCASLRADARALQHSLYGASGADDIFEFLRRCGYRQLVLMSDFPTRVFKTEPVNLLPRTASGTDKLAMAHTLCELSMNGWHVVLLGFGELQMALQGIGQAEQMRRDLAGDAATNAMADSGRQQTLQTQTNHLMTPNPGLLKLGWAALTGKLAAHTLHATYLSRAQIEGEHIQVNAVNFGRQQRWVRVPLNAFVNKFVGFVAATDIG